MVDGIVQVPALGPSDIPGKKVDVNELTRPDGSVVERQRLEIPAPVTIDGDLLRLLLIETRLHTVLMAQAFGITDDLDRMRNDIANTDDLD